MKLNFIKNNEKKNFTTMEVILLVIIGLLVGFSLGKLLNNTSIITKENKIEDKYLNEFIENYEYIINNYYKKIDKEDLINNAISGMMDSLGDPYSTYFNESESDNFSITLNGSYKGIGIQVYKDEKSGYVTIASVFKDSPAYKAGLKVGDSVVSIDNKDSSKMEIKEFSDLIKESDKKTFMLVILRDDKTLNINLNKSIVTLNSVASKTFTINNSKVGYIYIGIFANNTYKQFYDELLKLEKENIKFLIIDVRSNSGGHLTSVDSILDLFLNSKQIMYQLEQGVKKTPTYATGKDNKKYEIILLGNESSASASEVLISSLMENLNSKFFGKKTYGKGTVQELVTLPNGTQYKITTKKWLTPKGNWINSSKGIKPSEDVELDDKYFETYKEEDDTQLQAVFKYIKSK